MTTRRPGFAAFSRFRAPWRPMTFASAASRIAQVLMTTRSAASIAAPRDSRRRAGGRPSPRSRSCSSGSPASRRRTTAASATSGRNSVEALVGRVERRARAGGAGDRRREVEDGQGSGRHSGAMVVQVSAVAASGRPASRPAASAAERHPEARDQRPRASPARRGSPRTARSRRGSRCRRSPRAPAPARPRPPPREPAP